ncbi:MAG TPA: carboxypeptidase-like regulatory domain-containing protein, partial [Paludibacter sp.]|nr:carboxypeptidase-like regulatory domain-containing protein [Paludibacter sp.]
MKKSILLFLLLAVTQWMAAQGSQVTGVVTAQEDGQPLPGVSIFVQGMANVGTITNVEGKYSIKVPAGKSLTFRCIGYKLQVKPISADAVLNVALEPDS